MDALRRHVEQAQHVGLGLVGDGDDGAGLLDRGALHPGAQVVGAAELLNLPRAQRLERVDGQHAGHAPELGGEDAGHVRIPGVAVHQVGVEPVLGHAQAALERVHRAGKALVGALPRLGPFRIEARGRVAGDRRIVAERAHLDVDPLGQRAAEIFHVHPGPAVDVGRVFLGEQRDLHRSSASIIGWVTRQTPRSVRRNRLASNSGSSPTTRPSGMRTPRSTTTFFSRACRPIVA